MKLKFLFITLIIFIQIIYAESTNITSKNKLEKIHTTISNLKISDRYQHKPKIDNLANSNALIIEYQINYFNQLLVAIGIVLTILLVGFSFINFKTIPNILKKDIEDKFEDKYKILITQLNASNNYIIALNTADFYLTSIIPGKYYLALSHFFAALKVAISIQDNYKIVTVLSQINNSIDLAVNKELKSADYAKKMRLQNINNTFRYNEFKKMIIDIPDIDQNIVQLKTKILDILDSANNTI